MKIPCTIAQMWSTSVLQCGTHEITQVKFSLIRSFVQLWKHGEMHSQKTPYYPMWDIIIRQLYFEKATSNCFCYVHSHRIGSLRLFCSAHLSQPYPWNWTHWKHASSSEGFLNHFKNYRFEFSSILVTCTFFFFPQAKSSYLLLIRNDESHEDHEYSAHLNVDSKIKSQGDFFSLSLRSPGKLLILADRFPLIYFFLTAWVIALKCLVTL